VFQRGNRIVAPAVLLALALPACTSTSSDVLAPDHVAVADTTADPDQETPPGTRVSWQDAALIGPHSAVELDTVAHVTTLSTEAAHHWGLPGGVRATQGFELLLAHTRRPHRPTGLNVDGELEKGADAQVRVGSYAHKLPGRLKGRQTIVVSVRLGTDAFLAMTDSGRTQTLNLRTGKRGSDAVGAYYTAGHRDLSANATIRVTQAGVTLPGKPDNAVDVGVLAKIALQPYTEPEGWTAAGTARLVCAVTVVLHIAGAARFDLAKSFTLKLPDGRTVPGSPGTLTTTTLANTTSEPLPNPVPVTFGVPDTVTAGTVVFQPSGTVDVTFQYKDGSLKNQPVKWMLRNPGEIPFDLTL